MRARHRHFNARFAGASGVYDSRFISGLANNDAVSTWSSRTGSNDATQSTAANKPIYKIGQLNGNPALEFDGSNDLLQFGQLDASSAWAITILKRTSTNTYQVVWGIANTAGTNPTFSLAVHSDPNYGPVVFGSGGGGSTVWPKGSSLRNDEWRSLYITWLGGGTSGTSFYKAWDDGVSFTLSNTNTIGASPGTYSAIASSASPIGGQIAYMAFALISYTESLRKRVSHAAAYSFKLASS